MLNHNGFSHLRSFSAPLASILDGMEIVQEQLNRSKRLQLHHTGWNVAEAPAIDISYCVGLPPLLLHATLHGRPAQSTGTAPLLNRCNSAFLGNQGK